MTTATIEKEDAFIAAANWVREHKCFDRISSISWNSCKKMPWVFVSSIADLKAMFPGATAAVHKTCSSTDWSVDADGIHFSATKYGCGESPSKWEETL